MADSTRNAAMQPMPDCDNLAGCLSMAARDDLNAGVLPALLPQAPPILAIPIAYVIPLTPRFTAYTLAAAAVPPPLSRFCILQI